MVCGAGGHVWWCLADIAAPNISLPSERDAPERESEPLLFCQQRSFIQCEANGRFEPRWTLTGRYVAAARLSHAADVDRSGYRGLLVRYPQPFPVIL